MKISIFVDAGYAFDYYAILLVKQAKGLITDEEPNKILLQLAGQIGYDKVELILDSEEFQELFLVNFKTFNAVDLARENKIPAKEVDNLNNSRYICKKKIQNKFFNSDVVEVKNIKEDKF